jgi:hypothetical protein
MDIDSSLKAGTDVYLANGFKYGTQSQLLQKRQGTKLKIHIQRKTNLTNNLFSVYFDRHLYMFRAYL